MIRRGPMSQRYVGEAETQYTEWKGSQASSVVDMGHRLRIGSTVDIAEEEEEARERESDDSV
jgi:hypothetical protein